MTKNISYAAAAPQLLQALSTQGVFLCAGTKPANVMTIGWGNVGYIWGKPVLMVMVRHSRYTHRFLTAHDEFTVSIPVTDMKKALAYCGTKSGRDGDKFAGAGITAAAAQRVAAPIIGECGLFYECRVIYRQDMLPSGLATPEQNKWYGDGDYHTLYYGEIVACYTKE